jgi:hypothetical protein
MLVHDKQLRGHTLLDLPRKYPTGIQSFRDIIEGGYVYVDKTKFLLSLIDKNKSYLLSRPRRFGKSLTLSTFKSLFSGEQTLFEGLSGAEWFARPGYKKQPAILIDMSPVTIKFGAAIMNERLVYVVKKSAAANNIQIESRDGVIAFGELIIKIRHAHNERIALLIDEYDMPLLESIDTPSKSVEAREILQEFYSIIKSSEDDICFTFVTGISKLAKTGLSSTLNHLNDITYSEDYSTICGYTQDELLEYFLDDLTEYAKSKNMHVENAIAEVSNYYNGFSFDGKTKVYNPYSLLSFLDVKEFDNFWFESATPTFLEKHLAKRNIKVRDYIGYLIQRAEILSARQIENIDTALFLLQAGYLTLKSKVDDKTYLLDYPNVEVLASISRLAADNFFKIWT